MLDVVVVKRFELVVEVADGLPQGINQSHLCVGDQNPACDHRFIVGQWNRFTEQLHTSRDAIFRAASMLPVEILDRASSSFLQSR